MDAATNDCTAVHALAVARVVDARKSEAMRPFHVPAQLPLVVATYAVVLARKSLTILLCHAPVQLPVVVERYIDAALVVERYVERLGNCSVSNLPEPSKVAIPPGMPTGKLAMGNKLPLSRGAMPSGAPIDKRVAYFEAAVVVERY